MNHVYIIISLSDFFIGFRWDPVEREFYFFPIPCIGISMTLKEGT